MWIGRTERVRNGGDETTGSGTPERSRVGT
jgi:hypothetical protein